ncbi:MAG: tetratricopeptide repeat protein [Acidobacteriota bacterium]|nr:tetratricopeptide repeat protein [Blastocatellia bacterium]MDW8240214.1 tetratricopeptide repeat protein [Acidobacteriota bacterium]
MPTIQDVHAPSIFYGRDQESKSLLEALQHSHQNTIVLHGAGGIGKTALIRHTRPALRNHFGYIFLFDYHNGILTPEQIVEELHQHFQRQGVNDLQGCAAQAQEPEALASRLAQALNQYPTLLIFDHVESQLTQRDTGWSLTDEHVQRFFDTLLTLTTARSKFVFVSRMPFTLVARPHLVALDPLPQADAIGMMQTLPRLAAASWEQIRAAAEAFGGHPLSLVLLDCYCRFKPLEEALAEITNHETTPPEWRAVQLNYARLSEPSREMLNRLSAYGQLVPPEAVGWLWRDHPSLTTDHYAHCIAELISWGLLSMINSKSEIEYLVTHDVVRDFCRAQQMEELWRARRRDAAAFRLIEINRQQQANELAAVARSQMEAFELLIETDMLEAAAKLVLQTHQALVGAGLQQPLERQYRRLLDKVNIATEALLRHNLAVLLHHRGDLQAALQQYQAALHLATLRDDKTGLARSLYNIGHVQQALGQQELALQQYQLALKISEEMDDTMSMALALHQIGRIYQDRGEYTAALQPYQRALTLFAHLDDRASQARTLHNIGRIHHDSGEPLAALQQYQHSLRLFDEVGDQPSAARVQYAIGRIHQERGEHAAARHQFQLALNRFEHLNDTANVAATLHSIGRIDQERRELDMAEQYYQRALDLFTKINDQAGMASALHQLGRVYQERREFVRALECYRQSRAIYESLRDVTGMAISHGQVGQLFIQLGLYPESFRHLLMALISFTKVRSPHLEVTVQALKLLRAQWSSEEFDAAWQKATGETVPEWLT